MARQQVESAPASTLLVIAAEVDDPANAKQALAHGRASIPTGKERAESHVP